MPEIRKPTQPVNVEGARESIESSWKKDLAISDTDINLLQGIIFRMAGFLQDPVAFAQSVRQLWNPLPPNWERVLEIIGRNPIIGDSEGTLYWKYDIFSNPMPRPVSTRAEERVKPEAVAANTIGATVGDVRKVVATIRALDSAVRDYTEQRLNLDKLAAELSVLEVSPLYATFDSAAGSYLANAGPGPQEAQYPSLPTDRSVIQQYYDVLDRGWRNVKWTFFIAAVISDDELLRPTPSRTRTEAIRMVAGDLDFARLSTEQLQEMLDGFEGDLDQVDPTGEHHRKVFEELINQPLDGKWFEVMALRVQVEPPLWKITDAATHVAAYYRSRYRALILHLRSGKPLQRLSLMDLVARTDAIVPPYHPIPAFGGDPNAMPLGMYAYALQSAWIEPTPPLEFIFACMIKLGWGAQIKRHVEQLQPPLPPDDWQDLLEAISVAPRPAQTVLLILGFDPDGQSEQPLGLDWTLSQRFAVLPIYLSSPLTVIAAVPQWVWVELSFSLVLFQDIARGDVEVFLRERNITRTPIALARSTENNSPPMVIQPNGLDDAVSQALRLESLK